MKIEIDHSLRPAHLSHIHDGEKSMPMENFLLPTTEGDRSRNFVYRVAENVGRLLYSFYLNSRGFEESGMRGIVKKWSPRTSATAASPGPRRWRGR